MQAFSVRRELADEMGGWELDELLLELAFRDTGSTVDSRLIDVSHSWDGRYPP